MVLHAVNAHDALKFTLLNQALKPAIIANLLNMFLREISQSANCEQNN